MEAHLTSDHISSLPKVFETRVPASGQSSLEALPSSLHNVDLGSLTPLNGVVLCKLTHFLQHLLRDVIYLGELHWSSQVDMCRGMIVNLRVTIGH